MRRGLWVVVLSLLVFLGLGFVASESLGQTLLEDLRRQPVWALALALVGIVALVILIARILRLADHAWLLAESDGLRCSPHPHHGPRRWLRHDWELPWSDIKRAVVQRPGRRAQQVQNWVNTTLTLEAADGDYSLALLLWDPVEAPLDRPDLMSFRPAKRLHALTESHPLVEHLERRGIEVVYRPLGWRGRWGLGRPDDNPPEAGDAAKPVDLLSYPALVVMLSIMGVLGVLAALHFLALPPLRALFSPAWGLIVLVGSLSFALGFWLSGSVPARERGVVAFLLALAVGGLWHPLTLRISAMFGPAPETVSYIVDEPGRFLPLEPTYPDVDLRDFEIPEYWASLEPGQSYPLVLQRAGEDRWILRLGPVFDRTRAFYEDR